MKRRGRILAAFAAAAVCAFAAGCGSDQGPKPVATIGITPSNFLVLVGQTVTMTAVTKDQGGGVLTGRTVQWTSDNALVASFSTPGSLIGLSPGTAHITATSENISAQTIVTVSLVPVRSIGVQLGVTSLLIGQSTPATASLRDSVGTTLTGRSITWSSSAPNVAAVTAAGIVTAIGAGTANITAASELATGSAVLTVLPNPVASVTLSPNTATVAPGGSLQVSATTKDAFGGVVTGRAVSFTSSNTAVATVSDTGLVTGVTPGTVTVTATSEGKVGTAAISVIPGTLNFAVTSATLTQVVQRPDGSIRMVAGNGAVLTVFATSNVTLPVSLVPRIRVRVLRGTQVLLDDTHAVSGTFGLAPSAPSAITPTDRFFLAGSLIQAGNSFVVEINPAGQTGEIGETFRTDNTFPATGTLAINAVTVAPIAVHFVPIVLSAGSIGNVSSANAESYLLGARQMHPLSTVTSDVGQPFSVPTPFGVGDSNFWIPALQLVDALRVSEGSSSYYYGVIAPPVGVTFINNGGWGYIPGAVVSSGLTSRTALGTEVGWAFDPRYATETFAHELGHTLGRFHSPCGGAASPDPNYPYANAAIGNVVGYDVYSFASSLATTIALKDPAVATDLMGYCGNKWVSDYTYEGIMNFRAALVTVAALAPVAAPTQVLLVSGTIRDGAVTLSPSYVITAEPALPQASGPYRIEGLDADSRILFQYSFSGKAIDHAPGVEQFTFALPVANQVRTSLVALRVSGAARPTLVRSTRAATAQTTGRAAAPVRPLQAARAGANLLRVTWDTAAWPGVMLRDPDTHRILGFGAGGTASVYTTKTRVEVLTSDGVKSETTVVAVP